jgi:hypothetical protein
MRSGKATFSLILVLALLVLFLFRRWQEPERKEAFDRTPDALTYTKHARCRMQCRRISEEDISEIIERGIINFNKSDRNDKPCPTYALHGVTSDEESIRVIFAQCNKETKVITCYNLKEDFNCHCPGDPSKN